MSACGSSRTKRKRRSKKEMQAIRAAMYSLIAREHPMSVRQVFYRLVSEGVIAKKESEYKSTVCRLLGDMRRSGEIPYAWLVDNTRWMRKPRTHASLEDALRETARTYRRSVWADLDVYVEVWLEKVALAGVVVDVTDPWDVPLMVTRGFASLSYLASAAEAIRHANKPAYLYYFGDRDPSGVEIDRKVEATLRELAPDADISFDRMAVLPWQIDAWNLPTRPTKRSDSRAKSFKGESVELDAIPPEQLRAIVTGAISAHVPWDHMKHIQAAEESERALLQTLRAPTGRA